MIEARYLLSMLINAPLLPFLYFQAQGIRKKIPSLPEARGPEGVIGEGRSRLRLLSIGESTIAGVGVENHQQGFTGHLAKLLAGAYELRVEWRVIAGSGFTAKEVRETLVSRLERNCADLVIIGLGGNDTFQLNTPQSWRAQLHLLIDDLQMKLPGTPIVFINVPPVRSFPAFTPLIKFVLGRHLDLLHEVLRAVVAKRERVWYAEKRIELRNWLNHWPGKTMHAEDFFSDGVHPSELTYKTWAGEVTKFIRERRILE